jgi:sulfate adenylyltransferase subunit 1
VIRPQQAAAPELRDYRGYAGQIASGRVSVGDTVTVLPAGRQTQVVGIDLAGEQLDTAFAPQSVTLRLADEIDITRGDLIATEAPALTQDVEGTVAWLSEHALRVGTKVLLKHGTRTTQAVIKSIGGSLDLDTASLLPADELGLNDIGHVTLRLAQAIPAEQYVDSRSLGSFLLIDAHDGNTLAAGMVGNALLAAASA